MKIIHPPTTTRSPSELRKHIISQLREMKLQEIEEAKKSQIKTLEEVKKIFHP